MSGLIDSNEIGDQANLVICEFALKDETLKERKARRCGCVRCKADLEDATDRVNWTADVGRWHLSNRKQRSASA